MEALKRARERGILISLSTGRTATAASRVIEQLALDGYHMFFDGALVSDPATHQEIYAQPISEDIVRQAADFARRNEVSLEFYSSTHYFAEHETWATEIRRRLFSIEPQFVDFAEVLKKERIIKGTLTVCSPEERAKADIFSRHFAGNLHFSVTKSSAYPEVDFINVLAPGVSKRKALEAYASYLGITLSEVVAIGDGINDISLLSSVGLAIAMGNAPDEVKAVAHHITLDVDCNGLAAAIDQYLL